MKINNEDYKALRKAYSQDVMQFLNSYYNKVTTEVQLNSKEFYIFFQTWLSMRFGEVNNNIILILNYLDNEYDYSRN